MEIKRVSDTKPAEAVTCLVYGHPRSGKTEFVATAGDDCVILDVSGGLDTLHGPSFKQRVGTNPMVIEVFESFDANGMTEAKGFDKLGEVIDDLIKNRKEIGWNTLAIDEANGWQAMALAKAIKFNFDISKSKTWEKIVKKYDLFMPEISDAGAQRSVIEQFCDYYTRLAKKENFNFILVAHQKSTYVKGKQGEQATLDKEFPNFVGESAKVIPGYFEWVLHMECTGGGSAQRFQARTIGSEKLVAGVRQGGIFPETITNPNFKRMLELAKANQQLTKK